MEGDPRFALLQEALAAYASDPDDPPHPEREDVLHAAVALVVRGTPSLDLLLIRRARDARDPWSGHMALPGGRRDPGDAGLRHTAVRETLEETGVELDCCGAVTLGRLEPVSPRSRRLPDLTVFPFVFGVPPGTRARVASPEVERVHWVPMAELRDPASVEEVEMAVPGGQRRFPGLRVAGGFVWGLTYRIVTDFFEAWPDHRLKDPPPTPR